jgi:hypothetical protein
VDKIAWLEKKSSMKSLGDKQRLLLLRAPRREELGNGLSQSHFLLHFLAWPGGIFLPFARICSNWLAAISYPQLTWQANTCSAATAPKATNASINAYSTMPWPRMSAHSQETCCSTLFTCTNKMSRSFSSLAPRERTINGLQLTRRHESGQ